MAYSSFVLQDVFETLWMLMWLWYVPTSEKIECIRIGHDQEDESMNLFFIFIGNQDLKTIFSIFEDY